MAGATHEEDDAAGDAVPRKKFSGKKLVLFVVLPLLLVLGGGAAAFFAGVFSPAEPAAEEGHGEAAASTEAAPAHGEPAKGGGDHGAPAGGHGGGGGMFFNVPDLVVNLNSTGRRPSFLKISISIEVTKPEDVPEIEKVMPRIVDNFQVYLRELRLEDLRGSAGIYRLREELLMRVGVAAQPVQVKDVLFREMLIQ
ncbi:flagellar basal body protein FliL [Skermanella stibiiresistens SB22]|uniref:Flagellar protein FliL n=1 Tax=Skermanella stibiiresistens SB22 TaxID=1385369 RepID=W9H0A3_9PROT|nr:flagellar basal body-associated FliL family protein [Skermanella stibiiresistens]EWY37163.1 flagellar basal body protein FliL [Skermanella stibiiresistens SB22]